MNSQQQVFNELRKRRSMRGWTQQELARRVGVTRQTVISIEKGKYSPSVGLALGLAEVLETTVEGLFQLRRGGGDD